MIDASPNELLKIIMDSPLREEVSEIAPSNRTGRGKAAYPFVFGHGMGDSCFNGGMKSITKNVGEHAGVYSTCVPTGDHWITDTIYGYLKSMDSSVDVFAKKIKADPQLKNGFYGIGFSQGNSLIRGYIHKYNDPPVKGFLSVHGTVEGVAALPSCFSQGKPLGVLCKTISNVLGEIAYTEFAQNILFQAGYFRDAAKTGGKAYLQHSQIAKWNNEDPDNIKPAYKTNFESVGKYIMVKAAKDSMVYPNEGEQWGSLPDGKNAPIQTMKDTKFYQQNLFGLQTADAANKISFEQTPGDHLQFTDAELYGWVDKYFMVADQVVV